MKYAELVKKLKRLGCEYVRPAGGSHEIWVNLRTGQIAPIL
jgi:predicted RNA binding protein YcfA (HicA-like mRNA interferase family)